MMMKSTVALRLHRAQHAAVQHWIILCHGRKFKVTSLVKTGTSSYPFQLVVTSCANGFYSKSLLPSIRDNGTFNCLSKAFMH